MKNISEIYRQYKIIPSLQLHMLRVAAVAKLIIDNFDEELESQEIISACLLHDMGNILKFDFSVFPEFFEPEGSDYWQQVKTEYQQKYGPTVHVATEAIAEEIGVSSRTLYLIKAVGFGEVQDAWTGKDFGSSICEYADLRVTPLGITSLAKRWADLEKRYAHRFASPADQVRRAEYKEVSFQIEKSLFNHCSLSPSQITEAAANDTIELLRSFEVV